MSEQPWWKGAVIYQIYPRSLNDSNGDGIGDLRGIIEKLDYIASLGVDAIWISPFFTSPMKDFGYDISDYRNVDPMFGTLADFEELIATAHERDLKIIIDQVLSHTSDQHEWFIESRSSKNNPKADWYVWADAKDDGTQPNNWLAIFGGGAWQWDATRCQYYLHNFLDSQPDLNYHSPALRQQILKEVKFWLDKGVDGFRLDAINYCFHDQALRDNPPKSLEDRQGRGFRPDNPYAAQYHYYNNDRPENIAFLEELRALIDQYPGVTTLGEISTEDSLKTMAEYTEGDKRLHMAYSFELLVDDFCTKHIRQTVEELNEKMTDGWPCWALSNHDVARVASRWEHDCDREQLAKLYNALLCSLRGSVCSYQGEELGLTEAEVPFERLQDPYGINFWPKFKGRDGCRTPFPWERDSQNAGFSHGNTWLPMAEEHPEMAVDAQHGNNRSVLNHYRNMILWRKQNPALALGDIEFLDCEEDCIVFIRRYEAQTLLCGFNFTNEDLNINHNFSQLRLIGEHGLNQGLLDNQNNGEQQRFKIPAFSAGFTEVVD